MSLQAIIMAGGEGARLRPLTCDLPKPLVPVLGQPVMRYALQLLRRHGLTNIGATLQYLPSAMIRAFGDGREDRVSLRYFREEKPAGTAGSIKLAASALHHTFFVLSGDGLTDCDLQAALRFHKQRGALATLVLKRVPCPLPYGVVVTDETGRITRFIEKPGWDEACSDTVNTGIYILEPEVLARIPADQPYDFGSQLFPLLVSERQPVYGYVMNGYWCDIGDISAYLQAQIDFLHGRVRLESDAQPDAQGIWMAGDARIAEDARLIGPCYVGNNVQIDPGAIIGEDSVLCDGVHIGAQASVKRTVLWQDAFVGEGAQVRAAILCRNARMEARSQAFEDAVLGDYAQLGMQARLDPGIKVWPHKQIEPGMRVASNLVWGHLMRPHVNALGVPVATPANACMLAASFSHACAAQEIALLHDASPAAEALYAAVLGGLMAQGVCVTRLGEGSLPMLRRMQRMLRISAGIYVSSDHLIFTDALGIAPTREVLRRVEALAQRQDFPMPFSRAITQSSRPGDCLGFYAGALAGEWNHASLREMQPHFVLFVQNTMQQTLAQHVLQAAGLLNGRIEHGTSGTVQPWETGFVLDARGESITILDTYGAPDDSAQLLLRCQALLEDGAKMLVVPVDAPRTLERLAGASDAHVHRVRTAPEAFMQALLQTLPEEAAMRQLDLHFDGLSAMLALLQLLASRRTTLRGLLATQPPIFRRTTVVDCPFPDKGRILRELAAQERFPDLTDGLRVDYGRGWALLLPTAGRPTIRILGEAQDAEFAAELCERFEQRIHTLQQPDPTKGIPIDI